MVSISQLRQNIQTARQTAKKRKKEGKEAEEKLIEARKKLPQYKSQRALRQTYSGLKGREQRRKIGKADVSIQEKQKQTKKFLQAVAGYEKQVEESEKQLEEYLKTPSGKLQYAKEQGLKPVRYEYRRYARGYALEAIPVYATPYGEVVDEQYWAKYVKGQAKAEAVSMGFKGTEEMQEAIAYGKALGGNVFVTDTGRRVAVTSKGVESLNEQLSQDIAAGKSDSYIKKTYGVDLKRPVSDIIAVKELKMSVKDFPPQDRAAISSLSLQKGDTGLNITGTSKGNVTNVSSRVLPRADSGTSKIQSIRDYFGNLVSDIGKGFGIGDEKAAKISGQSVVSAYEPTEFTNLKLVETKQTPIERIRDFSSSVAAQTSAEQVLGVGNVRVSGSDIIKDVINPIVISPSLTFFQGGYEWQKKLEQGFQEKDKALYEKYPSLSKVIPQSKNIAESGYEYNQTYSNLLSGSGESRTSGGVSDLPGIVRKGFYDVGSLYRKGAEKVRVDLLGGQPLSEEGKKAVDIAAGNIFLGTFFSPLMETGATTKQKIAKQISKSKFESLSKLVDDVAKDVLKEKSQAGKLRVISEYATKYKMKPKDVKDLINILENQYSIPITSQRVVIGQEPLSRTNILTQTESTPVTISVEVPGQIKGAGTIFGGGSIFDTGVKPQNVRTTEFQEVGLLGNVKQTNFLTGNVIGERLSEAQNNLLDVKTKQQQESLSKIDQAIKQDQKLNQKLLSGLIQTPRLQQQTKQKEEQLQSPKQELKLRQGLITGLVSAVTTTQKARTTQEPRQKIGQPKKRPEPKRPFKPTFLDLGKGKEKKRTAKGIIGEAFKVFARKKGVDIEVGEARTEEEAFELLGKKLKGTLRASGFVTRAGQKVKPTEFGSEFRKSKLDPFRVVQKKTKRLSARPETREIQFFRKKRKAKGKGWF